jgi:hypothetical protein
LSKGRKAESYTRPVRLLVNVRYQAADDRKA